MHVSAANSSQLIAKDKILLQEDTSSSEKFSPEKDRSKLPPATIDYSQSNIHSCATANTSQQFTETDDELDGILDKSVLDWYNRLLEEARGWEDLLRGYKLASSEKQISLSASTTPEPGIVEVSNSCINFETRLKLLQQRYNVATDKISACIKKASSARILQENWFKRTKSKLVASYQIDDLDPKLILEKIFSCSETLFKDPLSSKSITWFVQQDLTCF